MNDLNIITDELQTTTQQMAYKVSRLRDRLRSLNDLERDVIRQNLVTRIAGSHRANELNTEIAAIQQGLILDCCVGKNEEATA